MPCHKPKSVLRERVLRNVPITSDVRYSSVGVSSGTLIWLVLNVRSVPYHTLVGVNHRFYFYGAIPCAFLRYMQLGVSHAARVV